MLENRREVTTQREILEHLNLKLREDAQLNMDMLKQRIRKGRKTKLSAPASGAPIEQVFQGTV